MRRGDKSRRKLIAFESEQVAPLPSVCLGGTEPAIAGFDGFSTLSPMLTFLRSSCFIVAASCFILLFAGCSNDAKIKQHESQAGRYYSDGDYDRAEIEYKNVLQLDPINAEAIGALGLIYFDQGRTRPAVADLLKARELLPDNREYQLRLAQIYVAVGKIEEARTEAKDLLTAQPGNPEAPEVLATAATAPADVEDARQFLLKLPAPAVNGAPVRAALGLLLLKESKATEAEAELNQALKLDPKFPATYSGLGALYMSRQDVTRADEAFATAANLSPRRSARKLQYANFKIQNNDFAAARRLLEEITQKNPDFLPGLMLLANLSASEKKYAEAEKMVTDVLDRDNGQPEALLLDAHLKMVKGQPAQAITTLETAARLYPHWPQVHYQLGLAYITKGEVDKAAISLTQAVTLAPNFHQAAVQLAELDVKKGNFSAAMLALQRDVQVHPNSPQARLLLAEAYLGQGNLEDALKVYEQMEQIFPDAPLPLLRAGSILVRQKKPAEAKRTFERALVVAPDYLPAIEQLINLDLATKNYASAMQRAEGLAQKNPKQAAPHLLLAKIQLAQNNGPQGEAELQKAIALEPDAPTAYLMLAGVYISTRQQDKALANLQESAAKNPNNPVPWMVTGIIHEVQKNYPAARDAYEKVLTIDPASNMALNNLAYLYSEQFDQLDRAFELAQKAQEIQPREPHTNDTLGWILYKKKAYSRALALLQDSVGKLPESAEGFYHLGMTQYILGEEAAATDSLQRALALDASFPGNQEARRRLALLAINALKAFPAQKAQLEKQLASQPDDSVALARLGIIYESEGALDQALDAYKTALQVNPRNTAVAVNLIQLYLKRREVLQATELGKTTRQLAPTDARVTQALGRIAFQTGDRAWAASLLQEVASKMPNDADALYEYGEAAYTVGLIPQSVEALQGAINAGIGGARKANAQQLLTLIPLADAVADAKAAQPRLEQLLKADPANVPALMAMGTIAEDRKDPAAARRFYEQAMERYPTFVPALRRLAFIYIANPNDTALAFGAAAKARDAYPKDAELAKVLGIALYRQEDFGRASTFLGESVLTRAEDPEVLFYLGMTQARLQNAEDARQNLQQALDRGLNPTLAVAARKTLGELK